MGDLMAARTQMATSLGFHIILAAIGMGLPVLLVIAEGLYLRTANATYLALARRWSKAFAVLFAVGAVSGTILSFELGLLWPRFMDFAGGIIGMPFSMEGFAFFIEAIFLGLYLYGWDRLSPLAHWLCGIPLAISGQLSGIFVVSANAWMNSPSGFRIADGQVVDVDPIAALFNPAWGQQALHLVLATFVATSWGVAGLYAFGMLRGRRDAYHRAGLTAALCLAAVVTPLQAVSGDISARWVAEHQPVKLAALEGQFETETGAPLRVGGIPDPAARETRYALELPNLLSVLAYGDPDATVRGLNEWPLADQPDPRPVHFGFQVMVGIGTGLIALAAWFWIAFWRRRGVPTNRWLLRMIVLATPAGFIAIEAGWIVTEVGRQPWIVYGTMRTADAVTQVPGQFVTLGGFTILYVILATTTAAVLIRLARMPPRLDGEMTGAPVQRPVSTGRGENAVVR